jgi:hypothetical protein
MYIDEYSKPRLARPDVTGRRGKGGNAARVALAVPTQFRRSLVYCKCSAVPGRSAVTADDAGYGATMCFIANGAIYHIRVGRMYRTVRPCMGGTRPNATRRRLKGEQSR